VVLETLERFVRFEGEEPQRAPSRSDVDPLDQQSEGLVLVQDPDGAMTDRHGDRPRGQMPG
jgi:hypothetical protein